MFDQEVLLSDHNTGTGVTNGPVAYGRQAMIRFLCEHGADPNCRWDDGRTLVHKAIDWPGLPTLLEFRPDVNAVDKEGRAPLHEVYGDTPLENVKLLVRAGADINLADGAGRTPLVEAVHSENLEVAEYLISRKPDLNKASLLIGGPLHIACKVGSLRLVEAMLNGQDNKADVHLTVPGYGGTPLLSAFAHGVWYTSGDDECERIINLLVEHGADVAAARGSLGTAVGTAALLGMTRVLELALAKGGQAGVPDALGRLALHSAALRGNMEAVEVLLEAGEDAAAADKAGRTALHWAVQGGDPAVVSLILTKVGPAAVNQRDKDGWTPLCWAARGCGCDFVNRQVDEADQLEVLNKLLEMGASQEDIPELPGKEWTPFGIATYHGRPNSVLNLLRPGTSCDYCYHNLDGYQYSCRHCKPFEFDLCYKCHNQRSVLHDPDHIFERLGTEFTVVSPSVSSRASSRQSSSEVVEESTSESNSDSEDSGSGDQSAGED
ncbi:ankyrin repeat protein [Apiospora aurea]|uniref:Ankyrin repeat protein n=1 Tax=Apiospora aurea TaxID=335848 RepID=A0ABR1Q1H2_9PEZI